MQTLEVVEHLTLCARSLPCLSNDEGSRNVRIGQTVPSATCTYDDHFHFRKPIARVDGEAAYLSRAVHRRSLKWRLVYEEWMDKDG